MSLETTFRTCPLCEAHCGIEVQVDPETRTVRRIRGDAQDPMSRGYICPKAHGLKGLLEDPDRLRRPLIRDGQGFREADWEEAFEAAAGGLRRVREAYGPEALALYVGNPTAHDLGSLLYLPVLTGALGTRNMFSAASCDQIPKNLACREMFGGEYVLPVPDVDRSSFLLVLGANPVVSNGSLLTAPDMPRRLKALRARGGRLVVVDPRRTETARLADTHLAIRPGGDAAFLLALVHVIFAEGLAAPGRLAAHTNGLDAVEEIVRDFPPERVESACGLAASEIRALARDQSAADRAACYGRLGTCTQEFGTLASWAVDVLNVVTGNLDREGGAMFARSPTPFPEPPTGGADPYGRWTTRVRGLPEVGGQLPSAALAEEIDTPGEGALRALFVHLGNPVLSTPNGARLSAALERLDFLVCHDFYLNETSRHADVILPSTSPLERGNADVFFYPMAARNGVHWSPAALPAQDGVKQPWEVLLELGARLAGAEPTAVEDLTFRGLAGMLGVEGDPAALVGNEPGPDRMFDLLLRAGPYELSKPALDPHGNDLGPLEPRIPDVIRTPSGKIELAPRRIVGDVDRLLATLAATAPELTLIGRRQVRSNNSWMHNVHALAKGRARCVLLVNPVDADARGLRSGDSAELVSRTGKLQVPIECSDEMRPGVVSLPHGFGHDAPGVRLGVASTLQPGVNSNSIADESRIDPLSGNAVLNGIPVELRALEVPRPHAQR